MRPSAEYRFDHVRGELGRGHVSRCPRSWLRTARRVARERGDEGMILATTLALRELDGERLTADEVLAMRRGTGRRTARR